MYYRTEEDVNDGYGNFIVSCREYTLLQTQRNSEIKLWKQKFSEIGSVLLVDIICHPEVHPGLGIQVTTTLGDNTNVWTVISRGPNRYDRYVDELRYRDPENSSGTADHECMQDTDQATDHSVGNVKWLHSDSWTEMERHHCQSILGISDLVITFGKDGSREFTDRDWINYGRMLLRPNVT